MFKFTRDDIKSETDSGSYIRGLGYFQQGRVQKIHVEQPDDNQVILYAAVKGSGSANYTQEISIDDFSGEIGRAHV